jgi:hypothetical protein
MQACEQRRVPQAARPQAVAAVCADKAAEHKNDGRTGNGRAGVKVRKSAKLKNIATDVVTRKRSRAEAQESAQKKNHSKTSLSTATCEFCSMSEKTRLCSECRMNVCAICDDEELHPCGVDLGEHTKAPSHGKQCSACAGNLAVFVCVECAQVFCKRCNAVMHIDLPSHFRVRIADGQPLPRPPAPAEPLAAIQEDEARVAVVVFDSQVPQYDMGSLFPLPANGLEIDDACLRTTKSWLNAEVLHGLLSSISCVCMLIRLGF